jgi:hypothetical protein
MREVSVVHIPLVLCYGKIARVSKRIEWTGKRHERAMRSKKNGTIKPVE